MSSCRELSRVSSRYRADASSSLFVSSNRCMLADLDDWITTSSVAGDRADIKDMHCPFAEAQYC
jgi:endogenous inhibitor of DNA gyrase (YacG/DUF329 family)